MCRTFLPSTESSAESRHSLRPVPRTIASYFSSMVDKRDKEEGDVGLSATSMLTFRRSFATSLARLAKAKNAQDATALTIEQAAATLKVILFLFRCRPFFPLCFPPSS
jgi:hypothetical protein